MIAYRFILDSKCLTENDLLIKYEDVSMRIWDVQ